MCLFLLAFFLVACTPQNQEGNLAGTDGMVRTPNGFGYEKYEASGVECHDGVVITGGNTEWAQEKIQDPSCFGMEQIDEDDWTVSCCKENFSD